MPLPTGAIFMPARYSSEDLAQRDAYQSAIDAYNTAYNQYQTDIDEYNRQIDEWNRGSRETDFTGVEPTAPTAPGFTQETIDQFQAEAQKRAEADRDRRVLAINVARNPEQYNFGGFGFAGGGYVPAILSGIGAYLPLK